MQHEKQYKTKQKSKKIITTFPQFSQYCHSIINSLNNIQGFYAQYKKSPKKLLKQHDGQYLLIQYRGALPTSNQSPPEHSNIPQTTNNNTTSQYKQFYIKINILYSLPFQLPCLYFIIYDLLTWSPLNKQQISKYFTKFNEQSELAPYKSETGIYITQNWISREYMYTLHHCQLNSQINYLVPFYCALFGLYPEIIMEGKENKLQDKSQSV